MKENAMTATPTLQKMHIDSINDVQKYTIRQEGPEDILKIYFKRTNPLLPRSKKYRFGRAHRSVLVDSGRQIYEDVYEISPFLQAALRELDTIVDREVQTISQKEALLRNLNHLEKVMHNKIAEIRKDIEKLS